MRKIFLVWTGVDRPPLMVHSVEHRKRDSQLVDCCYLLEAAVPGDELHGTLSSHQHVFIVEFVKHSQWRVCHHNLNAEEIKTQERLNIKVPKKFLRHKNHIFCLYYSKDQVIGRQKRWFCDVGLSKS